MEEEVKQLARRNRRRQRAQRMQAQAARDELRRARDADSGEDESPARDKPPRPRDKPRRRRSRDPLGEEDIIDGFAIMAFRTYEDLEAAIKSVTTGRTNSLSGKPRLPLLSDAPRREPHHHQPPVNSHGITLLNDAGTSDDSGRASERLTGSSVAPRDPDSSRDRLSDASSRCSSGKGYICDSEGDDDKDSPKSNADSGGKKESKKKSGKRQAESGAVTTTKSARSKADKEKERLLSKLDAPSAPAPPQPSPLAQPTQAQLQASSDNSRNGSPRYHDPSSAMEDTPENGPIFRVTGGAASAGGGAAGELAARGGSGGALALSKAPVGGSASPAPAPLPHPAPSPAPAALPPPALPPPHLPPAAAPHRAHRPPSAASAAAAAAAHMPSLEARTPAPAAPPDPPATDLQPSPTPAPPFAAAYPAQAASAAAVPHDYRHTEHEARTRPPAPPVQQPHAPHPPRPLHHHHPPHPILPGQDVRPLSYHTNGIAHPLSGPGHAGHAPPHSAQPGAPTSPKHLPPKLYSASTTLPPHTATSSAHSTLGLTSTVSNHSISYQSQPTLPSQKHVSLPSHGRPQHPPFGAPNHLPPSGVGHSIAQHLGHTTTNHSLTNHLPHSAALPTGHSISNHVISSHSTSNHAVSSAPPLTSAPGFGPPLHNHRAPALAHPLHPSPASAPTTTMPTHSISNHTEAPPGPTSAAASGLHIGAPLPAPAIDTRPAPAPSSSVNSSGHTSPAVVSTLAPNGYLSAPGGPIPPTSVGGLPGATYTGASYPPLYAPYATSLQHTAHPYLPPSAASPRNTTDTRTSLAASPLVAPKTPKNIRPHTPGSTGAAGAGTQPISAPPQPLPLPLPAQHVYSPRGHSPNRERDSYSSNISSLSRASGGTPVSYPSLTSSSGPAPLSSVVSTPLVPPLVQPLVPPLVTPLAAPTPTPAAPPAAHLAHTLAPVPTVPSISSSKPPAHWGVSGSSSGERSGAFGAAPGAPLFTAPLPPPNPNPFSAESLFQTSPSADLLRRELDNRFLAAAGGAFSVRTEMHHHQHQHTHVHQHPPLHPPPHPASAPHHPPPGVFLPPPVPPMFKDVKMASLYRHGIGLGYPYSSGLLHPGLSNSTPFMPPTFTPKPVVPSGMEAKPPRPPTAKTGKWNAMHVRIAWEIYNHQQKGGPGAAGVGAAPGPGPPQTADKDKLRASSFPPVSTAHAPSLSHTAPPHHLYRSPYDHLPPSPYLTHHPHLGVSPFARYGAGGFPGAPPPFGLSPYTSRDLALSSSLHAPHHPSSLAALHEAWRTAPRPPAPPPSAAAAAAVAREHEERERARRERESRERRDADERERRKREMERVRQRSPLRNGLPEVKEEKKEAPRPPPPLAYPPPPAWDPYRPYDLQHMRFTPLVEAAIRAEEDRAKMLSAYAAHHQQMKPTGPLHRPLPPHHTAPHAGLVPLSAPLAPLPHLDLLKKEEPR